MKREDIQKQIAMHQGKIREAIKMKKKHENFIWELEQELKALDKPDQKAREAGL